MERVRFVEYQSARILRADLSGLDGAALRRELEKARELVRRQPPSSLLVLVDVAGIPYTMENVRVLRTAAVENSPHVRARAVIGLPEIARLSFSAVAQATGRPMRAFRDIEAAREWLLEQA